MTDIRACTRMQNVTRSGVRLTYKI